VSPEGEQISLFAVSEVRSTYRVEALAPLEMSREALQDWKQRIYQYQEQVRLKSAPAQGSLFEAAIAPTQPDLINPFALPQQNTEFWRWKAEDQGVAALYFVMDYELPILLYVGETVKSNQRWKGEHDCKRYLVNYRQVHYRYQLPSQLGIAFWSQAPVDTRDRQRLELALISQWRSPFNKENWHRWSTPFVGGK